MNPETLRLMAAEIRKEFGPPCVDPDDGPSDHPAARPLIDDRCPVCAAYEVVGWVEYWIGIEEEL
jgi:hypothetical protein